MAGGLSAAGSIAFLDERNVVSKRAWGFGLMTLPRTLRPVTYSSLGLKSNLNKSYDHSWLRIQPVDATL